MIKKFIFLISFVSLIVFIPANIANAIVDQGLVEWLSLNDGSGTTASDASGNGNEGTLNGAAAWTTGKFGGGVHLGGLNDYLQGRDQIFLDGAADVPPRYFFGLVKQSENQLLVWTPTPVRPPAT